MNFGLCLHTYVWIFWKYNISVKGKVLDFFPIEHWSEDFVNR